MKHLAIALLVVSSFYACKPDMSQPYTPNPTFASTDTVPTIEISDSIAEPAMANDYNNIEWDTFFKMVSKKYSAIFYDSGNLPIINVFVPLQVYKVIDA